MKYTEIDQNRIIISQKNLQSWSVTRTDRPTVGGSLTEKLFGKVWEHFQIDDFTVAHYPTHYLAPRTMFLERIQNSLAPNLVFRTNRIC